MIGSVIAKIFTAELTAVLSGIIMVGAAAGVFAKIYSWLVKRGTIYSINYQRQKALDKFVNAANLIEDVAVLKKEHQANSCAAVAEIKAVTEALTTLAQTANETIDHNRRQDKQIRDSLEEREVIMSGLEAILDWMSERGANGSTKRAKQMITDYNRSKSHRFETEQKHYSKGEQQ